MLLRAWLLDVRRLTRLVVILWLLFAVVMVCVRILFLFFRFCFYFIFRLVTLARVDMRKRQGTLKDTKMTQQKD